MLDAMGLAGIPVMRDRALNERDYGDLAGLDKDEAARGGVTSRSIDGAGPMMCVRPAARA